MSAQYGKCNFDGTPVDPKSISQARLLLAPHGPDIEGSFYKTNVSILYRGFHTTKESHYEAQPHILPSGAVLTWDGRLDNRHELVRCLEGQLGNCATDVSIVAAAYDRWGTDSFAKLIGDWALSIWVPSEQSLILAKDPVGVRSLYYSLTGSQVRWSTILDPLVLLEGQSWLLDEEYIVGCLASFPAVHLTPYAGIHSVPPSSFVLLRTGRQTTEKYWDFDSAKRIRYRTDQDYEEQFLTLFAQSVRWRLRSDTPILAELSGGMDSSSIVCIADTIIARNEAETPRLDTLSYYSDSEPNWDERPYFAKVEEKRGRRGRHIAVSSQKVPNFESDSDRFAATPGAIGRTSEVRNVLGMCINEHGNRVLLSGIGGDEVLGGVPTPRPELQDLLARMDFGAVAHQLKLWALTQRKPWFYLLVEAAKEFFPASATRISPCKRPAPWIDLRCVKRHRAALSGYESRIHLFGPLPSFQHNLGTLETLRRQLGCSVPSSEPIYEKRYPYLDRLLLEFLYAIPREQLVRPHQRRSLMRRALAGIVPNEVLNRKRKACCTRGPTNAISMGGSRLVEMEEHMVSASLGIVDSDRFSQFLKRTSEGGTVPIIPMLRTICVERWLRELRTRGILADLPKGLAPTVISV
jgi:asparagine synthase (glutamine-hydrolysing)